VRVYRDIGERVKVSQYKIDADSRFLKRCISGVGGDDKVFGSGRKAERGHFAAADDKTGFFVHVALPSRSASGS
jgi:hypothetical protein